MSRENVNVVRAMIDAWNGGDLDDVAAYLADGIEWLEVEGNPEFPEEIRGSGNVRAGFEELYEQWQCYRLEPEQLVDAGGGKVVAIVREVARGRASGVEVASRWGYVVAVRDGKLVRVEAYRDPQKALEAVA